jgi:hypothetical protein
MPPCWLRRGAGQSGSTNGLGVKIDIGTSGKNAYKTSRKSK